MKTDHAVYHQIEPDHEYASLDTGEQVSKESTFMRLSTGIYILPVYWPVDRVLRHGSNLMYLSGSTIEGDESPVNLCLMPLT